MTENNSTTPDHKKIIQIAEHFKSAYTPWVQSGIDALDSLSQTQQQAAIELLVSYFLMEIKLGLGLVEPTEAEDDSTEELTFFNRVADIYEEAAGGCYFCSETVDPNEDEFGPDTRLCPMCKLKLANFTEALGVPAGKVFQGVPARPQKTRIKIK